MKPIAVAIFAFAILAACMSANIKKHHRFSEDDVLRQLDSAFNKLNQLSNYQEAIKDINSSPSDIHYTFMLDLEHGYSETAGSRITLYADTTRWAIVFEKSGYENRGGNAEIELDYFGNCVTPVVQKYNGYTYHANSNNIELISGNEYENIRNKKGADMDTFEKVSPDARIVNVRGKLIPIEHDLNKYLKLGILPDSADNPHKLISYGGLLRYIYETNPVVSYASDSDIRKYIPADLPKIITIDRFHFESIYNKKNLPRLQETYQLFAKVLVSRDSSLWKPTQKPNNHWSNWISGNL